MRLLMIIKHRIKNFHRELNNTAKRKYQKSLRDFNIPTHCFIPAKLYFQENITMPDVVDKLFISLTTLANRKVAK